MINYKQFSLDNDLKVIVYPYPNSSVIALNILYNVGSKDEDPGKTGFAHLFEHLMFGGSKNVPNYDKFLEKVGGVNNAFTNSDVTNYYCLLPSSNIETAFWLESDRMLQLSFKEETLNIQKKVVAEEYKEGLNRPFGDFWDLVSKMMYTKHPYRWPTIGSDIKHVLDASLQDVENFFTKYYGPNNATFVIAGDITFQKGKELAEKWFGSIPKKEKYQRNLPIEPKQNEEKRLVIKRDVPMNAIYKAYHVPGRYDNNFSSVDLLVNILGSGKSSRLYENLVTKKNIFTNITAFLSATFDPGLLIIVGHLNEKVLIDDAEKYIDDELEDIKIKPLKNEELQKVKNQFMANMSYSNLEILNVCTELAMGCNQENTNFINEEIAKLNKVKKEDIRKAAIDFLDKNNLGTIIYEKIDK